MSTCLVEVSNISRSLRNRQLKELFECCGPIKNLELKKEPRICLVEYFDPNHATAALTVTGTMLGDKKLVVEAKPQPDGIEVIEAGVYSSEGKLIPAATIQLEAAALVTETMALSGSSLAAAKKKADEIARTIYVGNLHVDILEDTLRDFFASCGEVLHVHFGGDNFGRSGLFAFVEFKEIPQALSALKLTGQLLDQRPIKIGKAQSPILKVEEKKEKSLGSILAKIKAHASKISEKLDVPGERSQRRRRKSRSRSRKRKSRSRSRTRRSRSRSRSRSRERHRRSRRDRSNSPRKREPSPVPSSQPRKKKVDRSGMFFDGYQWQPVTDLSQLTRPQNRMNQK